MSDEMIEAMAGWTAADMLSDPRGALSQVWEMARKYGAVQRERDNLARRLEDSEKKLDAANAKIEVDKRLLQKAVHVRDEAIIDLVRLMKSYCVPCDVCAYKGPGCANTPDDEACVPKWRGL